MTHIHLHNTLTRKKEAFTPERAEEVRMYVCGPTVYDRAHLGNARSVVVYDVLFRILRAVYGEEHVVYVRNITDVDDKINARAKEENTTIQELTREVTGWFHEDMGALNNLVPTYEPRATQHIAQMIVMIEQLLERGIAYESQGHVLYAVEKFDGYGLLSGRKLEDLQAGARVEVGDYKQHPGDFVLWKPANEGDDPSSVFDSPWGAGRPGWHIECSAMSVHYLGETFDIHGGGADLMFPHHENEIAQSCGIGDHVGFANTWVHNGFLTVAGEKMSKSLGNFKTVRELLDEGMKGEVIRLAFMSTKYNEPLDFNDKLLSDAHKTLDSFYRKIASIDTKSESVGEPALSASGQRAASGESQETFTEAMQQFLEALGDDMNTPKAISLMHSAEPAELKAMGEMLGFFSVSSEQWFHALPAGMDEARILEAIDHRAAAKKSKDFALADAIRKELLEKGVLLEDKPGGKTEWRRV